MFAIGIDIGGTNTRIGLVSSEGALIEHKVIPTDKQLAPEEFLHHLIHECSPFIKQAQAIGIGIAGQSENGFLYFSPNLNWHQTPLTEIIGHRTKLPVIVENDVRAALWGEWVCGAGKGYEDILFLSLGTGLGGAIVSGNRMVLGDRSAAGEIGHLCIDFHGRKCTCGAYGCLEAYVGGWAIRKEAEGLSPKEVFAKASQGDSRCADIVKDVVDALAAGVSSLLNVLNPRCVIFGGGIFVSHPELVERVKEGVVGRALAVETESLVWKKQEIQHPGVIGSALCAMKFL